MPRVMGAAGVRLFGAGELLREVDGILDLVCVWGDMEDALGALGDLFECFGDV